MKVFCPHLLIIWIDSGHLRSPPRINNFCKHLPAIIHNFNRFFIWIGENSCLLEENSIFVQHSISCTKVTVLHSLRVVKFPQRQAAGLLIRAIDIAMLHQILLLADTACGNAGERVCLVAGLLAPSLHSMLITPPFQIYGFVSICHLGIMCWKAKANGDEWLRNEMCVLICRIPILYIRTCRRGATHEKNCSIPMQIYMTCALFLS
jgi:hypothetical protein